MTAEQIAELKKLGYTVEDMGAVHGPDFAGCYRWLNAKLEATGASDGFGCEEYSEFDAWQGALAEHRYLTKTNQHNGG